MKHPYAHALTEIFGAKVSSTQVDEVKKPTWADYVKPVRNYLKALVITNRVPGQEGIDMLIIGDDRTKKLSHWAEVVEKKQGRPMNYVVLSAEDFIYRQNVRDKFVMDVLEMDILETYDPEQLVKAK